MKIRVSFVVSTPATTWGVSVKDHVLGYDLRQVLEALGDWWVLWRAGRRPRIWLERSPRG